MPFTFSFTQHLTINRAVGFSVGLHGLVVICFFIVPLLAPRPAVVKKSYLFQMVSSPPRSPVRMPSDAVRPKPAPPPQEKAISRSVKKIPPSKSKFTEKVKVRAEDMPVPLEDMPVSREDMPVRQEDMPVSDLMLSAQNTGFRYSYYETILQMAIKKNWNPPDELREGDAVKSVIVDFSVLRNGDIIDCKIKESSWNTMLDRQAIRAVETAKLPPLPDPYSGDKADFQIRLNLIKK
jgi:TonB family protein